MLQVIVGFVNKDMSTNTAPFSFDGDNNLGQRWMSWRTLTAAMLRRVGLLRTPFFSSFFRLCRMTLGTHTLSSSLEFTSPKCRLKCNTGYTTRETERGGGNTCAMEKVCRCSSYLSPSGLSSSSWLAILSKDLKISRLSVHMPTFEEEPDLKVKVEAERFIMDGKHLCREISEALQLQFAKTSLIHSSY